MTRSTLLRVKPGIAILVVTVVAVQFATSTAARAGGVADGFKKATGKVSRAVERLDACAEDASQALNSMDQKIDAGRQQVEDYRARVADVKRNISLVPALLDSIPVDPDAVDHILALVDRTTDIALGRNPGLPTDPVRHPSGETTPPADPVQATVALLKNVRVDIGQYDFERHQLVVDLAIESALGDRVSCPPRTLSEPEFELWVAQGATPSPKSTFRCLLPCDAARALQLLQAQQGLQLRCEVQVDLAVVTVSSQRGVLPVAVARPRAVRILNGAATVFETTGLGVVSDPNLGRN